MHSPRLWKWLIPFVLFGVVFAVSLVSWPRPKPGEYRRYSSPDGRFQIVVFRVPNAFAMPGQSGDALGYFQLRDARTGKVLRQRKVEMVALVDRVEWSATNVHIRLLAAWPLPQ